MSNKTGSMTSVGDTVVLQGAGEQTALVTITGTFSAATINFEISPDGVKWYPTPAVRLSSSTAVTSSGSVSSDAAWLVGINGFRFRTNLTAISSGTVSVAINSFMTPLAAALPPGTISYGNFFTITSTPTVSTSPAYTSGDNVGGKNQLANVTVLSGGACKLQSVTISDNADQKAAMSLLIFNSNPAAGTFTDNAATALSTDQTKIVARIPIAGADFVSVDSKATASLNGLNRIITSAAQDFYFALHTTGTPTYAAVTDLKLTFGFER